MKVINIEKDIYLPRGILIILPEEIDVDICHK